jgi:nitrous oxide reductase accessory protein NosL
MRRLLALLFVAGWFTAAPALAADPQPPKPRPKEGCGVCGMYVTSDPLWTASLEWKDGSAVFFDGPKDLFKYLFRLEKYAKGRQRGDVARIWVTERSTNQSAVADTLFFVLGSRERGPMGDDLVPLRDRAAAEAFQKKRGGEKILTLEQITPEVIAGLE